MLVKNDQISLTEETNKTENLWTHGVAVLLFRKRKNDRNMISWWVALKLYVSQTALEGTHKSSHPESRSLNPYFSHRLNYVPARFCWFGGSPIGLIGGLWATAWVKANDGAHLTFPRGSDWRPCSRISMESPITLENTPHLSFSIGSKTCQKVPRFSLKMQVKPRRLFGNIPQRVTHFTKYQT